MATYLHIGSTKTGSSALQQALYSNRAALEKRGYLYPDVGIASGAHHLLAACFHQNAHKMHEVELGDVEVFKQTLSKRLNEVYERNLDVIISSEYLWTTSHKASFIQFLKRCGSEKITVICYLREITDWLQSQYNQAVKHGLGKKFSLWLREGAENPNSGFNYKAVLDDWRKVEDVEQVVARVYDKDFLKEGIFRDFMHFLGADVSDIDYKDEAQVNPSPSFAEVRIISTLNGLSIPIKDKIELRQFLINISPKREKFQEFPAFPKEDMEFISSKFRKNLALVQKMYIHPEHSQVSLLKDDKTALPEDEKIDAIIASFLRISIGLYRMIKAGNQ